MSSDSSLQLVLYYLVIPTLIFFSFLSLMIPSLTIISLF
uniref:Uncharacterized protein n=1 Tax=Rhizophora mucronata TaxID=61149 RepID=A0A2P2Q6S6_RHIMU